MIDPKNFLSKNKKEEPQDDSFSITGSFTCQECDEVVSFAKLNEDNRKITWTCSQQHYSEAKL